MVEAADRETTVASSAYENSVAACEKPIKAVLSAVRKQHGPDARSDNSEDKRNKLLFSREAGLFYRSSVFRFLNLSEGY